jgi:succinate dehydrogenase / fumarate reductase flavoprotein subunit
MMGGIATDVDGRVLSDSEDTVFPGLYAAGECACVSVHGANRLGCNALLELLVFGRRTGKEMSGFVQAADFPALPPKPDRDVLDRIGSLMASDGNERLGAILSEMQEVMMDKVSVFRQEDGLSQALDKVRELKERYGKIAIQDKGNCFNRDLLDALELGNMLELAEVITVGALQREESRGAHSREDFPERNDENWLVHTMANRSADRKPQISYTPVTITKFQPMERKY